MISIIKERARILSWNADSKFAKVGLLSNDSIEWLIAVTADAY